jgi:hypothetical protein
MDLLGKLFLYNQTLLTNLNSELGGSLGGPVDIIF